MSILIIEDDERVAHFMKRGLKAEQYEVDVVSDAESGIERGTASPYELIILDLFLPEPSGIEVCQQLRKRNITTPILIITAKDSPEARIQGLSAGADDYLLKPFPFEELVRRIKNLVTQPPPQSGRPFP